MSNNFDIFNFHMEWEGLEELHERFDKMDKVTTKNIVHAMVENTEDLLGKSMKIAPVDEGTMIGSASARVNQVEVARGSEGGTPIATGGRPGAKPGQVITGEVSYNTPYAARQHEELTWQHLPGKQAKYLEQPLKENVTKYMENLRDAMKEGMKEGTT